MTRKLFDPHLNLLERRFQAFRDYIGVMPETCGSELEGALQALFQHIVVLGGAWETGRTPPEVVPGGQRRSLARGREGRPSWTAGGYQHG